MTPFTLQNYRVIKSVVIVKINILFMQTLRWFFKNVKSCLNSITTEVATGNAHTLGTVHWVALEDKLLIYFI